MRASRVDTDTIAMLIAMVQAPSRSAAVDLLSGRDPVVVENLIRLARLHGIEAWLAACAPRNEPGWDELATQRARFHAARMRTAAVIDDLSGTLGEIDCAWVVLKGPALGQSVYPRPELRFGVDLDVLVPPERFEQVLETLKDSARYELLDQNWPIIEATAPGELRVRSPRGVLVDLHWSVINTATVRHGLPMPTSELLARSRCLAGGMPVLGETDQLIHLGVHGALSGANKLSWLLDADLAARRVTDWDPIVDRSRMFGASGLLALVLGRAQRVLGTPVPGSVLRTLSGGRLILGANRALDVVSPIGPDPDLRSVARAWARATRASPAVSLLEVARHGREWLREGHLGARPRSSINDESSPTSPLHPVNDLVARAGYLAMVAAQH